ncbi:MAG: 2-C-methyl-D-erythritol 4-phosphate cytidylyltransferase [Acidobacteria bacterium]|nr:2-C-methyl-D-erythritol 4-phosphate cytidylyltransferase [Acidobacteriota bacterium]
MKERKVAAILPAAGLGVRMGLHKKPLLKLDDTPILVHTLRKFSTCQDITEIFIAAPPEDMAEIQTMLKREDLGKSVTAVPGGSHRQESVENCLRVVPPDTDLVAVHDAVRPFVSPALISAVIEEAAKTGAAILGVLSVDTVKQVERTRILGTLPRERIVLAQTPQVFRYDVLKRAFAKAREEDFHGTDEASLVEHLGEEITVVPGSERNIKITKPSDLDLARFYLEQERHTLGEASTATGVLARGPRRPAGNR